jgi:hypothetical protein
VGEPAAPIPAIGIGEQSTPAGVVWRRDPRWVFRVAADQVVLAAPDGIRRTLEGQAAAVWVVLDRPGSAREVAERVRRRWPASEVERVDGVEPVDPVDGAVDRTLAMLAAHDLIGPDGPTVGSAAGHAPTGSGDGPAPT